MHEIIFTSPRKLTFWQFHCAVGFYAWEASFLPPCGGSFRPLWLGFPRSRGIFFPWRGASPPCNSAVHPCRSTFSPYRGACSPCSGASLLLAALPPNKIKNKNVKNAGEGKLGRSIQKSSAFKLGPGGCLGALICADLGRLLRCL